MTSSEPGTVLVTGGGGFLGSHVCRELVQRKLRVVGLDMLSEATRFTERLRLSDIREQVQMIYTDIRDPTALAEAIQKYGVDAIVHTAALTFIPTAFANPALTFDINTAGTMNLLEAARIHGVKKFIYISTASIYGDFTEPQLREDAPPRPKDVYGATKAAADLLTMSYHRSYHLPACVIRTTTIYGPGDLEDRVVKQFVERALLGKPLELHGSGAQYRDFSYVKDVARGIALALLSPRSTGETFHLSGNSVHTIQELASMIQELIPGASVASKEARAVDARKGALDTTKARTVLGYEPRYSLRKGLEEYIRWMRTVYLPTVHEGPPRR